MRLISLLPALLLGGLFCLVTPPAQATDSGVTLRVAYDTDPLSLDIHEQLNIGMLQLAHLAFDPLIRWDRHLDFEPRLATDWERIDSRTLRLHLRHGVRFHSGNRLRARDVVWTVERLQRSPDFRAIFSPLDRVSALDDFTVELHTRQPYPLLLNLATYIFPMDSAFYSGTTREGHDKDEIIKNGNTFAATHLSGTGPFRVIEREPGVRTEFARFEDYWDEASPGNVDHITLTPIAEDATRVAALLSGDVDFISPVPSTALPRIQREDSVRLVTMPGNRITMLQLNQARVPAFRDRRVRQAFAYAVDQRTIANRLLKGTVTPAAQMSPTGYSGHDSDLTPRYDLARARELMQEAGYGDGFQVTLMAPNNRYVNDAQTAQVALAVSAMLARINVDVEFTTLPKNQYWSKYDARAADIMMLGWYSDTGDSANFFEYLTFCPDSETGAGRYNASEYCRPAVDALVRRANLETDSTRRSALLRRAERLIHDDAPFIPLYWPNLTWAAGERVHIERVVNVMNMPYLGDVVVDTP
ncbi:ABC transporter substrate-binding protein [Salinicola avicenniae]|uniref:ABC transporter substrate-binding protein n=1 Tax=Salinicola avicenniae TaxID=2916836 RepID=UPI002072C295|nr:MULTISPECIES: ABC transporter substrate-binding protein [unclassified Salinicola]